MEQSLLPNDKSLRLVAALYDLNIRAPSPPTV
jgi:hypothetical protein